MNEISVVYTDINKIQNVRVKDQLVISNLLFKVIIQLNLDNDSALFIEHVPLKRMYPVDDSFTFGQLLSRYPVLSHPLVYRILIKKVNPVKKVGIFLPNGYRIEVRLAKKMTLFQLKEKIISKLEKQLGDILFDWVLYQDKSGRYELFDNENIDVQHILTAWDYNYYSFDYKFYFGPLLDGIFGINYTDLVYSNDYYPRVLDKCFSFIETFALHVPDLFRKNLPQVMLENILLQIESADFDIHARTDPHIVTGIIKLFIDKLPEPLFPGELYNELILCVQPKKKDMIKSIKEYLDKIPKINHLFLSRFFRMCYLVDLNSDQNKTTADNLGKIFHRYLIREINAYHFTIHSKPATSQKIVSTMIKYYYDIFGHKDFHSIILEEADETQICTADNVLEIYVKDKRSVVIHNYEGDRVSSLIETVKGLCDFDTTGWGLFSSKRNVLRYVKEHTSLKDLLTTSDFLVFQEYQNSIVGLHYSDLYLRDTFRDIHPFLSQLFTIFKEKSCKFESIFNNPCNRRNLATLVDRIQGGVEIDLWQLSIYDISSFLVHFLNKLPEPLFSFDLYEQIILIADIEEISSIINTMKKIVKLLPSENFKLLKFMLQTFLYISTNSPFDITPHRISTIFGPLLISNGKRDEVESFESENLVDRLTEIMIKHVEEIFSDDVVVQSTPRLVSRKSENNSYWNEWVKSAVEEKIVEIKLREKFQPEEEKSKLLHDLENPVLLEKEESSSKDIEKVLSDLVPLIEKLNDKLTISGIKLVKLERDCINFINM
eukprot:TRINITY_DN9576_c0_g1_i1.p1 TRINITY_DN9576_c0_g1~~TRINITY_DN9576_c0_g1_i1.p1  ORF type:complete len:772 (+),score=140.87 TRINITY_DN9576_c0_g1_i1:15-2330(+)